MRIQDESDQVFQYRVARPLAAYDPNTWFTASVAINNFDSYFGGANNGLFQGNIKSIFFIVESTASPAGSGFLVIDNVSMVSETSSRVSGTTAFDSIVDDFENRSTILPWKIWVRSSLTASAWVQGAPGYSSAKGLALNYTFSCSGSGGNCVPAAAATIKLPVPLPAGAGVRFMTRSSIDARLKLRVVDSTGQIFQYAVAKPIEAYNPAVWYQAEVDLSKPASHWGGAADGVIHGSITEVWMMVEGDDTATVSGFVHIDDIELVASIPSAETASPITSDVIIDDFDRRITPLPWATWTASAGSANAHLDTSPGHESTRGLRMNYALNCAPTAAPCSSAAASVLALPTPTALPGGVAIRVKAPTDVELQLRLLDVSGQMLQYALRRPLDGYTPSTWYLATADMSRPTDHWGGVNTGVPQGGISEMWIVVRSRNSQSTSGAVDIDTVTMTKDAPVSIAFNLDDGRLAFDDFDTRPTHAPWEIESLVGSVDASLGTGAGYNTARSMLVTYNATCASSAECMPSIVSTLALPEPLPPKGALSFWARVSKETQLRVRVTDETGQTLQYETVKPIAAYNPNSWYKSTVALAKPDTYWGGAATGQISGNIVAVSIVVWARHAGTLEGSAFIDQIGMADEPVVRVAALSTGHATIDNFDDRLNTGPWYGVAGGDSGASGSVALGAGNASNSSLAVNYAFNCVGVSCGYVGAWLQLPKPIEVPAALSISAKALACVQLHLRLVDEEGQSLQYRLWRPLEGSDATAWFHTRVAVSRPDSFWGGRADGKAHGSIEAIQLIVQNIVGLPCSGTANFDDLSVWASTNVTFSLDPDTNALTQVPPSARKLGNRLGVAHHLSAGLAPVAIAAQHGIQLIRSDLYWTDVERNGVYDFKRFEPLVTEAEAQGMGMLFILDYGHPDHDVRTAAGRAAFAAYAKAAAQYFAGRSVSFEVWNEPDTEVFWGSTPDPQAYASLCRAAIDGVHQGNPAAKVSTGGLAGFNWPYMETMLMAGAAQNADAVAIHGYRDEAPETIIDQWITANWVIKTLAGRTLPMWLTEWGYSTNRIDTQSDQDAFEHRQAVMLARGTLSNWASNIPMSIWYNLVNKGADVADHQHHFGLLNEFLQNKPGADALAHLVSAAADQEFIGLATNAPAGVHVMGLQDETGRTWIVWNTRTDGDLTLSFPDARLESITDMYGTSNVNISANPDGVTSRVELSEAAGPVYLRFLQ